MLIDRLTRLPPPALLALALLAGLLSALGLAPRESIAPAIAGAAALLLILGAARSRRQAFGLGWVFGWGHFVLGLDWIATAFTYQAAMPAWMGWVAVVGLGAFLAIYPGLAALAATSGRTLVARTLILAAAWMLTEWLRGILFTGFAWNPYGASWLQLPGVAGFAALAGSGGLSALAWLCGGSLAALLAARGERGRWVLVAIFPFLLAVGAAWGKLRPSLPVSTGPTLLIIQADVRQPEKLDADRQPDILRRYLALTAYGFSRYPEAVAAIWPEAAIDYLPEEDPTLRPILASVLPEGRHLLFGGTALIREGEQVTAATNSLFALDHVGRLLWRYDKAHLVPGGEYLPLRAIAEPLGLARVVPGSLDFRPGPGPLTLAVPGLPPLGASICYEIIFPGAVTQPGNRPAWLLTVSNDAWFGDSGPPQHWAQARLRAIEEGLPVVRSTPTGISGFIDARGGVVDSLPQHTAGVLAAPLPAALPPTPFARIGHAATMLFGLLLLMLAWLAHRKS